MIALKDIAINNSTPSLSTDFVVAIGQVIADNQFRVWFTRQPNSAANTTSNYTITGPQTTSIIIAQSVSGEPLAIDLIFNQPLIPGQWVISFSANIKSSDTDNLALPTATKIVFDTILFQSQDVMAPTESALFGALPNNIKNKDNWNIIASAIDSGDSLLSTSSREAYKQILLNTATGSYLIKRAADQGINNPAKVGLSDDDFRQLAITIKNDKLTSRGFLELLEVLFGYDSVHAYLQSQNTGPFQIFNGATLSILVDGYISTTISTNWANFKNPLQVTADELVAALNIDLDINKANANAQNVNGYVRIYSNTKGLKSSIQCTGGTLQNYLVLDQHVNNYQETFAYSGSPTWNITNPSVGVVRYTINNANPTLPIDFTNIQINDFVSIIGSEFPIALRGSYPIINVGYTVIASVVTKWFDINSSVTAGLPTTIKQSYTQSLAFFRPVVKKIFNNPLWASVTQIDGTSLVSMPSTSQAVQRSNTLAAYMHSPQIVHIGP